MWLSGRVTSTSASHLSDVPSRPESKTPATLGSAPERVDGGQWGRSWGETGPMKRARGGARGERVGRVAAVAAQGLAARSIWQYVSSGMAVAVAAAAEARAAAAAVEARARAASAAAPRGV